jgi:glycerate kinase
MSKILVCLDSFKQSISSINAGNAIKLGWQSVRPKDEIVVVPFADGGEGTIEAIQSQIANSEVIRTKIRDVNGGVRESFWLLLPDGTAIIELAEACGISKFIKLSPTTATTFPLGELIFDALMHPKITKLIITLGGSASTDGGTGVLQALGYIFKDENNRPIEDDVRGLKNLAIIDSPKDIRLPQNGVEVWVDVFIEMLGESGTAKIFARQKGASDQEIVGLDEALIKFHEIARGEDFPGAGAAGGTAYSLSNFLGAKVCSGSQAIAELVSLVEKVKSSDLVITGEGKFDAESSSGKATGFILDIGRRLSRPVALICGSAVTDLPSEVELSFFLRDYADDLQDSISHSKKYLIQAGKELALKWK